MSKVVRQIRIEPKVEDAIQEVADRESRTFSSACNWLLGLAARKYLDSHNGYDFYRVMGS